MTAAAQQDERLVREALRRQEEQARVNLYLLVALVGLYVVLIIVAVVVGLHLNRKITAVQESTVTKALKSVENFSARLSSTNTAERIAASLASTLSTLANEQRQRRDGK